MKEWVSFLEAFLLALFRISGMMLFAPVFLSPAIPARIKAGFSIAIAFLLAPGLSQTAGAPLEMKNILGELAVGLLFGLSLSLLTEMVTFASTLLGMSFSFSLVNLIDPVSKVETPVLGQLLGWLTTLVLLYSGLDRTMLAAFLHSFDAVPVGRFLMDATTGARLAHMMSGVFLAGLQLAAPVVSAALVVELTIALIGRVSPQLPTTILSVPLKTMISYGILIGSLALWPVFLEHRFLLLLQMAVDLLRKAS